MLLNYLSVSPTLEVTDNIWGASWESRVACVRQVSLRRKFVELRYTMQQIFTYGAVSKLTRKWSVQNYVHERDRNGSEQQSKKELQLNN